MGRGDEKGSPDIIVRCSWCGKIYKVHTDRLPGDVSTFPCRGCGSPIPIAPLPGTDDKEAEMEEGAQTILVAECEEDLAGLIRKILNGKGYRVLVGSTGEETLRIIEEKPVDLLLVGVFFPDIMGFEILDRIRQREGEEPLPTILLSSVHHGAKYKRAPTSLYGADDYIERHHLPDLLLPKIERLLKGGVSEASEETRPEPPLEAGYKPVPEVSREPSPESPPKAPPEPRPSTAPLSDEQVLQKREIEEIEGSQKEGEENREQGLRRLCRVIAGDIVLYNEDRIRTTEPSRILEALKDDLIEGEALLEGKFGLEGRRAAGWLREEVGHLVQMRVVRIS